MAMSEYERTAQQEAVAAVERRWKQKNDAFQRQRRARRFRAACQISALLAILLVVGYFTAQLFGIDLPDVTQLNGRRILSRMSFGAVGGKPLQTDKSHRDVFAALLASFGGREVAPWQGEPPMARLRKAAEDTRYIVLTGKTEDVSLYELVADGKGGVAVMELSPLFAPVGVAVQEFQDAVSGRPYFVLRDDAVYMCGSDDLAAGCAVLRKLLGDKPVGN